MRKLLILSSVVLLIAALATLNSAGAQEDPNPCPPPTDLGELGDLLTASGTWSTEECDNSEFLENRPGQRFLFSLAEEAEVRIDLSSDSRDALVYLLAEDGRLIDSDDDTGGSANARIERVLPAGTYQIEASAVGWSGRETGAFELTLRVVRGCREIVDLGRLEDALSADAVWSHFGCESSFRPDRSSQRYRFELVGTTRVQIDLTSNLADPYVYLLDAAGVLLESDDDGGVGFNSRIVRLLGAGAYTIEATNWGDRDLKNLQEAPYQLNIGLAEDGPIIKLEAIEAPDRVVLGLPFEVHYRVGNLGDTPLSAVDGSVRVRLRWPYVSDSQTPIIGTGTDEGGGERWGVGASYHTNESVSAFGSEVLPQLESFDAEFTWRIGPTDVMLEALVLDEAGDRIDRHWLTRPIMVLSGIEFAPVTIRVDDADYLVAAIAEDDGQVTTEVTPAPPADESANGDESAPEESDIADRAIYAAGVRTRVIGEFNPIIESLQAQAESLFSRIGRGGEPLSNVPNAAAPTLDVLLETLNATHSETLMNAGFERRQFQSAASAENIVVRAGRAAAKRIDQFTRDWADLTEPSRVISASEALRVHAELEFATQVDLTVVEAAALVVIKREAEDGWSDPDVAAALDAYAADIDCDVNASSLAFADSALRQQSPVYGFMLDRAYCGALAASKDHELLLTGLDLESNPLIPQPQISDEASAPSAVAAVRLLARVLEDGQVGFAVDLSNGERALPVQRLLPANAPSDRWLRTGPVIHDGEEIGRVHARRLSGGLVQATYVPTGVSMAETSRWIVPEDAPLGAWLASGDLERSPESSGDDLVQRVGDQAAGAGATQLGDHLTLLSLIENNLQRNP